MHQSEQIRQKCIAACRSNRDVMFQGLEHCLEQGGRHVEKGHMKEMLDCMAICDTAIDFMLRQSKHHHHTCGACAEVCESCARSCRDIGGERMDRCARSCMECAEACREMVRAMQHA